MTLIEVLAGLAILGGLMTAILFARARLIRQYHLADRKWHAVHAADALLERWTHSKEGVPVNNSGEVAGQSFRWQTTAVAIDIFQPLNAQVVTLQIHDSSTSRGSQASLPPLCEVQLLQLSHEPASIPGGGMP